MDYNGFIRANELANRRERKRSEWRAVIIAAVFLAIGLFLWVTKFNGLW